MAASIFDDKALQPEAQQLANAPAKSAKLWEKIQNHSLQIEVKTSADVSNVLKLVALKTAN
jgi:hypothetical protein